MRLIDADELLEHVWRERLDSRERIAKLVESRPTIIPERKRKKNAWVANGDIHTECPFCGEDWDKYVFGEVWYTGDLPKFCPNCGEDMREGEAE